MTDITELAQSLKAAAIDAKELAIIARYSKGRAATEKFYALANPNNVIALVEALEKAQQRIAELESRTVKLPPTFWYEHDDLSRDVPVLDKRLVKKMLREAGIKVEAE
ncbi:ead/Ea22-like family protein [Klebsiella pneumoniae]